MRVNYQNFAITKFSGYYRGIGQSWIHTVRELIKMGVEPYLIRLDTDRSSRPVVSELKTQFKMDVGMVEGYMRHVDECYLEEKLPYYRVADWFIKEGIVHSWDNFPVRTQRPQVVTLHDTFLLDRKYRKYRMVEEYPPINTTDRWDDVDVIVTPSEFSKRDAMELLDKRHHSKIVVIPWGSKFASVHNTPMPDDGYFLYVSSPEKRKNFRLAVEAVKRYREVTKRDATLMVIANPDILNVEDRCDFYDLLTRNKFVLNRHFTDEAMLRDLYSRATALLFPSDLEGFGMPGVEAASLGCPVIYRDSSALSELSCIPWLKDTGVASEDVDEWAEVMVAVREVRSSMQYQMIEYCGLNTFEKTAEAYMEQYRRIS